MGTKKASGKVGFQRKVKCVVNTPGIFYIQKTVEKVFDSRGWRDGSAFKSTCCSCGGPTSGGSELSVTPALQDQMPLLASEGTCTHLHTHIHTCTHAQTQTYSR